MTDPANPTDTPDPTTPDTPKKRRGCAGSCFGCLGRLLKYGTICLLVLAALSWWMLLRDTKPKISEATHYITEPLTEDGRRVDYFTALEEELYTPGMKTDKNGYRMIVEALGPIYLDYVADSSILHYDYEPTLAESQRFEKQVYEKLGFPNDHHPAMSYEEPKAVLIRYIKSNNIREEIKSPKHWGPWTLDDLPMMAKWLEKNGPALDMVAQAVRCPEFCIPLVQNDDDTLDHASLGPKRKQLVGLAEGLVTRAKYRIAMGNFNGAIDDIVACKRLGRHIAHTGFVIDVLCGYWSCEQRLADKTGLYSPAGKSQPTEAQLKRLLEELNNLPPRVRPEKLMTCGRYKMLSFAQAMAWGEYQKHEISKYSYLHSSSLTLDAIQTLGFDWEIIMRQVNEYSGDRSQVRNLENSDGVLEVGALLALRGHRSKLLGDLIAEEFWPNPALVDQLLQNAECRNNLHRITLVMLIYERQHGALPPAWSVDSDGQPLHSWRVLLLPYLGEQPLYDKLRLDEPWDSEHNSQFHDATVAVYQCPTAELEPGQTGYTVVVGENTAFSGSVGRRLDEFGPQRHNLLLVTERVKPVCWMDPTLEVSESATKLGIKPTGEKLVEGNEELGSAHQGCIIAGFAGGFVDSISETTEPEELEKLLNGTCEEIHE